MPRRRKTSPTPTRLPPCDGPKLNIFPHHKSPIEWLERLDCDGEKTASEGYVFRARIEKKEYAIKVFNFFDPRERDYFWAPLLGRETPLQTAAYYTDPFFAECRAYGRIQEGIQATAKGKRLRPNIAVSCHGFLFLRESDEQRLRTDFHIDFGHDAVDPDYQQKVVGGYQVRAIVKSLASHNTGVDKGSLGRILRGIKALNRQKIFVMDIRLDNYRDGMIVDFGSAWTEPYPPLDAMDTWLAASSRSADMDLFDEMVEEENIPNPNAVRATCNHEYYEKLRPRQKK